MSIIDEIEIYQDWTEDGYRFEKKPADKWVEPFVASEYINSDVDPIVLDIKVENAESFKANQDAVKKAIQKVVLREMPVRVTSGLIYTRYLVGGDK